MEWRASESTIPDIDHIIHIITNYDLDPDVFVEVGPANVPHVQDIIVNMLDRPEKHANSRVTLIEARPNVANILQKRWEYHELADQIVVVNCAISDKDDEEIVMYERGSSTFIENLQSPQVCNLHYEQQEEDKFTVMSKTFNHFDDGNIDVLLADVEGAEYFVLSHMHSRPQIIVLETHSLNPNYPNHTYINPYIEQIENWMEENNYVIDQMGFGDTVFVRKDIWLKQFDSKKHKGDDMDSTR